MLRANRGMAGLVFLACVACGSSYGQADESTATLRGTVYDAKGAVIPNARVTATNPATGVTRSTVTGPDGTYQIPQLNPAKYQVQATAEGFERERANEVVLTVGQVVVLDGHLLVGSVDSVVEVNGDVTPLIATEQTQQASTLNEDQIQNLPNASRNFLEDVFTLPGVGTTAGAVAQNQGFYYTSSNISVGAGNGRGNLITVNSGEDDYGTGAVRYNPPLDAVQETQVNRNGFQAEFGFASGAAINTITKSGTNRFHGDVFGAFNDHYTDAETYLGRLDRSSEPDPANPSQPQPKPFSQQIYAGGSIGGPIVRNKLFFFASYEFDKFDSASIYPILASNYLQPFNGSQNDTSCFAATPGNPILNPSQGCFFQALANNPAVAFYDASDAATAKAFLNSPTVSPQNPNAANPFFPLSSPALQTLASRDNGIWNTPIRYHNVTSRFDYQPSNTNTLTGSFSVEHGSASIDGVAPDGETNPTRDYEVLSDWIHIFTPNLFNKLLVQYAYNRYDAYTPNSTGPEIQIQYLPGPFGSFGHNFASTYYATEHRYEFSDDLSWTKGKHNTKFGLSYRPANYNINNPNYSQGEFDFFGGFPLSPLGGTGFSGFQNTGTIAALSAAAGFCPSSAPCIPSSVLLTGAELFDMGIPYSFEGSSGSGQWQGWANYAGVYGQDLWKITPNLTLTYGGRVDWDAEPSPLSTYKFVSPRVGLAWSPYGDQRTLIRAGGGIFVAPTNFLEPLYTNLYGPLTGPNKYLTNTSVNVDQLINGVPAYNRIVGLYQGGVAAGVLPFHALTAAQEGQAGLEPGVFGRLVQTPDARFTNQKVYQASLSVDQQLAQNLSLELGYLFYRGNHLPTPILVGYAATSTPTDNPVIGPMYQETAPYAAALPGGTPFDFASNGTSTYHGATVSLTKRASRHYQFQANYTWSRSIDDATDFDNAFASYRPNGLSVEQERGVSSFNRTNVFVGNLVYNTLGLTGQHGFIRKAFSNMTVGPVFSAYSGVPFDVDISTPFNNGTPLGNLAARPFNAQRNSGQGPGNESFDLKVSKAFALNRENSRRLALTMDGSNLFNKQNYTSVYNFFPSSVSAENAAGQVTPSGPFGPNNALINFATGPYNLRGGVPTTVTQQNSPLYFNSQGAARAVQVQARIDF